MRVQQRMVVVALGVGDVAVLVLLRPRAGALITDLAAPHTWVARAGADAALATLASTALWLAALWLALGLAAAAATRLPGGAGRCSARACGVLLPCALRGLVAGSAGLGVLLAPVAALADHGPGDRAVAADTVPAPAWPVELGATPATPVPAPQTRGEQPASHPVTVRAGDSLWLIAARSLGPRATDQQVAAAWPRWFAANRAVIGADPALLRPGQVLRPPAPAAEEARP